MSLAVDILARGKGRIQERLINAWVSQGHHAAPIDAGEFDPSLEHDMQVFHERITRVHDGPKEMGSIHNTVMTMTEDEASDLAQTMTDLVNRLRGYVQETGGRV